MNNRNATPKRPDSRVEENNVQDIEQSKQETSPDVDGSLSPAPIVEWKSYGSEKEILAERIKNSRDYLINVKFYKKRKFFGKPLQSRKVDTMDTFRFLPSFKDPRFVEMRKERDFGVQWTVETVDHGMQTPWFRTINSATQVSVTSSVSEDQIEHCLLGGQEDMIHFLKQVEQP